MIRINGVSFSYNACSGEEQGVSYALRRVNLDIRDNEFIAFLGPNGSGKSSLSRLLNGIETPTEGTIEIDGLRTDDAAALVDIRRKVQIVFQNPENQQVGITVGEDIAFGLSNRGWPRETMPERIRWALEAVGLDADEDRPVARLSGGEKQKLALAAVMAIDPEVLILDEATSMLDPGGRRDFLNALAQTRERKPFSLIYITHHLEEVLAADRWALFSRGELAAVGQPEELWTRRELLGECGLELPYLRRLALEFGGRGFPVADPDNLESWRKRICESN
ncbi:ATP-binding cassette domain-containing protein [Paenibacillaceae bacterium WGS1546]|uniref:ATP-binding cassette domain-containing protein n=1 Tax=Cohnella sp. WGS1546 TaxID=3366810 RepID=UPI00372CED94